MRNDHHTTRAPRMLITTLRGMLITTHDAVNMRGITDLKQMCSAEMNMRPCSTMRRFTAHEKSSIGASPRGRPNIACSRARTALGNTAWRESVTIHSPVVGQASVKTSERAGGRTWSEADCASSIASRSGSDGTAMIAGLTARAAIAAGPLDAISACRFAGGTAKMCRWACGAASGGAETCAQCATARTRARRTTFLPEPAGGEVARREAREAPGGSAVPVEALSLWRLGNRRECSSR